MENKILSILTRIRPEFDFQKIANFIDDGMLDSFDIVILVEELDKAYSISIDGADIVPENFANLESIVGLLIKSGIRE